MEFDNDCPMDRDWKEVSRNHEIGYEEFSKINKSFYCENCSISDCHAKRKSDKRSEGIWVK